jgi:hypothetical protein
MDRSIALDRSPFRCVMSVMRKSFAWLTLLLAWIGIVAVASADHKFRPVPATGKARAPLSMKVVAYDGAVNGLLTVEVKNTSTKAQSFTADGLYFVPDGDPDQAPQRLGAVGPLQLATAQSEQRLDSVVVPPGKSIAVKLAVFCIDSHRPAPSSQTEFSLGHKRLPRNLTDTIESNAKLAADKAGGYAPPAATAEIQGEVWKARDAKWISLDGEGAQEAGK